MRTELVAEPAICRSYIAALILGRRFEDAASVLKDFRDAVSQDPAGVMHARLLTAMFAILTDRDGDVALDDAATLRCSGVDAFLIGTLLILQAYVALRRNRFDEARRIALRARDAVHNLGVYERGYAEVVAALADRAQGDLRSAASRFEQMFADVRGGPRNPAWVNAATGSRIFVTRKIGSMKRKH